MIVLKIWKSTGKAEMEGKLRNTTGAINSFLDGPGRYMSLG